jgi:serine protease Do
VQSVLPGEPAEVAGVKPGDTIVQVDGTPVKDTRELIGYVSGKAPGSSVRLTVFRDGKELNLTAKLAERGGEGAGGGEKGSGGADESRGKIGISVEPVTPQIRKSLGLDAGIEGLYVNHVKEVSPAFDAGIRDGDIITQVNGRAVNSTDEFARIVKGTTKGDYLRLYVFKPQGKVSLFALVKIED